MRLALAVHPNTSDQGVTKTDHRYVFAASTQETPGFRHNLTLGVSPGVLSIRVLCL